MYGRTEVVRVYCAMYYMISCMLQSQLRGTMYDTDTMHAVWDHYLSHTFASPKKQAPG